MALGKQWINTTTKINGIQYPFENIYRMLGIVGNQLEEKTWLLFFGIKENLVVNWTLYTTRRVDAFSLFRLFRTALDYCLINKL